MPPARPPIAPEAIMVARKIGAGSMPTALLKRGFRPTRRDRKPPTEKRLQIPYSMTRARLIRNPRCRVVGGSRRGSSAFGAIKGVAELAEPRASSGPLTSQLVSAIAIKLSMSVVTTSSTPKRARKRPGTTSQRPPTKAAVANVENPCAESDRRGETCEQEWRRRGQGGGDLPLAAKRFLDHQAIDAKR